ncbi:DUF2339 domain-containing protein [Mycobacterium sp. 155]|uniref:DUF2339 domain-containing protein n=1 Tax=Mycobacterium sp. 155 TaxID=1157943 RepID=UPI00037AEC95|nr:DUF2339 domain-containing protein [Mycobacterium sp. 155]
MTEPHRALISRLAADISAINAYTGRVSADLAQLDRLLAYQPVAPHWAAGPYPAAPQVAAPVAVAPPVAVPAPPPVAAPPPRRERPEGWIGKVLAVAGVAVTLVGVVLLVVLAAQAGILRPGFRVAAGAVLAVALIAVAWWQQARPGGRIGAIALAATGIAAAYIDVIAVTAIYHWVSAPVGLTIAAVIGGAGLTLARMWDSEHLGLLVLVPLIVLAPVVTDGVTLLLIGFMLALSAATLPVQWGRDWMTLHVARITAGTVPLLVALMGATFGDHNDLRLALACAIGAVLAVASGVLLLRWTANKAGMALTTAAGTIPLLCVSAAVDRAVAALMIGVLAAALVGIAAIGNQVPGVTAVVRQVWSVLSAVAALIAVTVAFEGTVAGPVLLAMAVAVAITAPRSDIGRWAAVGFAVVGGLYFLSYAPPETLMHATELSGGVAASVLTSSILAIAAAVTIVWSWRVGRPVHDDSIRLLWVVAAAVIGYAVTTFTVTVGVLVGGTGAGFFGGHMAATICWIVLAAGLFHYAASRPRLQRSLPIGGGLALVAAAMAKLFLFDLGTLDGIFRVAVFIVVGLTLLGMGAGYARLLSQQDKNDEQLTESQM